VGYSYDIGILIFFIVLISKMVRGGYYQGKKDFFPYYMFFEFLADYKFYIETMTNFYFSLI